MDKIKTKQSIYGNSIYWEDEDGSTTWFNTDHYSKIRYVLGKEKVKKARKTDNNLLPLHLAPTLGTGKKFIDENGKEQFIQSVHQHEYMGYYICLLYYSFTDKGERSHGTLTYKNISCQYPDFKECFEENKNIQFIDSSLEEKIDIIINKCKKLNLPCIIHINEEDAINISTIDILDKNINIDELIKKHKESKEPLLISNGLLNCKTEKGFDYIDLERITDKKDINYFCK